MTNQELIDKLKAYPLDTRIIIRWEDFAFSTPDDELEYDEERNELYISHDCT